MSSCRCDRGRGGRGGVVISAYIFETILSKVALEKFPVNVELADLS